MNTVLDNGAKEYIASHLDELKELIVTLCGIPAPSHHEERRAEFCKCWFEDAGFKGVYIDEAKNVICPLNLTENNEITVFMAHTDTVFPDMEPMPIVEADNKLYCPGVGDDTSNLAIMMLTARYMLKSGRKPSRGILFVANSCEEGLGNLKGCRSIMDKYGTRVKELISFDGEIHSIVVKAVGSARYKIEVKTEGGHSYNNFGNNNAIQQISALVNRLYEVEVPTDENSKTTYNVGMISGGTSVNTIAQQAEIFYEYRSDSNLCLEKMKRIFEDILEEFRAKGVNISIELLGLRPGMEESRDKEGQEDLFVRAETSMEASTGKKPSRRPASTDCNIPFSMGISSVSMGLIDGDLAHTREEFINLNSLPLGFETAMIFLGHYFE